MSDVTSFPNVLRAQPDTVILAGGTGAIVIRVQAAEAWDAVRVSCLPTTSVSDIKRAAMRVLLPDVEAIAEYCVKYRGFLIDDESQALSQTGARASSTLFITARRRRPLL